jgi:hypothetical protein
MKFQSIKLFTNILFTVLLSSLSLISHSQPAGLLYDPEPPTDSAYVRVILASQEQAVEIMIDGRKRIEKLKTGEASEYMIIPAGKHSITLRSTGKPATTLTTTIDIVHGKVMTLAFVTLRPNYAPTIFEDKANTNRLKAILAVYHLDAKTGPLDVLTSDAGVKVFTNVAYESSTAIHVNPISIELMATKTGEKVPQVRATLEMKQGGTYSMLLVPGQDGKLVAKIVLNKIEKYTGK